MEIQTIQKKEPVSRTSRAAKRASNPFSISENIGATQEVVSTANISSVFTLNEIDLTQHDDEISYQNTDHALRQLNNIKQKILYNDIDHTEIEKLYSFLNNNDNPSIKFQPLYQELKTLVYVEYAKLKKS